MNNIGDTLKKLREENGLKGNEVVERLKNLGIEISVKTLYGYESGRNSTNADMFLALCQIYKCRNIMEVFSNSSIDVLFTNKEWEIIEKYRSLDPHGKETVSLILDRESARVKELQDQRDRIAELEAGSAAIIELPSRFDARHLAEYFHDASAGSGIFILGNESPDKIAISESDWDDRIDYIIRVNGKSMEPDYMDGDNVKVSQRVEMRHGDVGIFVVDGKAYIKEYGETELISRNPSSPNIPIHEYDNIVCMGKVLGKLEGEYKIITD